MPMYLQSPNHLPGINLMNLNNYKTKSEVGKNEKFAVIDCCYRIVD
jgi:hypothetical protein